MLTPFSSTVREGLSPVRVTEGNPECIRCASFSGSTGSVALSGKFSHRKNLGEAAAKLTPRGVSRREFREGKRKEGFVTIHIALAETNSCHQQTAAQVFRVFVSQQCHISREKNAIKLPLLTSCLCQGDFTKSSQVLTAWRCPAGLTSFVIRWHAVKNVLEIPALNWAQKEGRVRLPLTTSLEFRFCEKLFEIGCGNILQFGTKTSRGVCACVYVYVARNLSTRSGSVSGGLGENFFKS